MVVRCSIALVRWLVATARDAQGQPARQVLFVLGCWLGAVQIAVAQPEGDGVYVITLPERTREAIEKSYADMPPVKYAPPTDRWKPLPRTASILAAGSGELRVLMLGDSIVNDTSRSGWEHVLQALYPRVKIVKVTCVRGSTGCWWYKTPERLKRYVVPQEPDLLIIGGISHRDDIASVGDLIDRVRAEGNCDFLLMTPAFGTLDPFDHRLWSPEPARDGQDFRSRLVRLVHDRGLGILDMTGEWGRYVRASGKMLDWFKRDAIHANERGEQVLGRILAAHLAPPLPGKQP